MEYEDWKIKELNFDKELFYHIQGGKFPKGEDPKHITPIQCHNAERLMTTWLYTLAQEVEVANESPKDISRIIRSDIGLELVRRSGLITTMRFYLQHWKNIDNGEELLNDALFEVAKLPFIDIAQTLCTAEEHVSRLDDVDESHLYTGDCIFITSVLITVAHRYFELGFKFQDSIPESDNPMQQSIELLEQSCGRSAKHWGGIPPIQEQ